MTLAEIGKQMVASNNQATSFPVWVVGRAKERFPRFFLSEASANTFALENGYADQVRVASAFDNDEAIALMKACIEAAGLMEHDQVRNAYLGFRGH